MKNHKCCFVVALALSVVCAHAELQPIHADSPWLRARAVEIAKTARTELDCFRTFLADMRPVAEAAFASAPGSIERERVFKRLWIAEDTCDFVAHYLTLGDPSSLQFVERGLEDLRLMKAYFREELELWKTSPLNPAVKAVVIDASDYGIVGDGKTANGAAFLKVFEAVRKLGGKPCLVKVPVGVYRFADEQVSPRWRHENQFTVSCLTNVAIVGASPETTKLVWGVYDCRGGVIENCSNLTLRGFEIFWEKNPFTEGLVSEANADEGSCVMTANPRAKMPTEKCFKGALSCQFDEKGKICFDSSFAWLDPARPVEDLGGGRYKLYFNRTRYGDSYRQVKPNRTICIPDRDNRFHGFHMLGGRFITFDSLWFRNSRAAAFSTCRTHQTCATRCRIFPQEGCVLSTCADGYYSSSGSYFAHSDFTRMHDDANNSHSNGLYLYDKVDDDTLLFLWNNGRPKRGDLMLLTSPLTGQYLGNVRVAADAVSTNWQGNAAMLAVKFESLPPNLHTFASLGMKAFTREEQDDIIFGRKKVDRMPDHIYVPGLWGVASVVTDCRISSLRNVALPIQCPNELVESNVIENISTGLNLCALVQWMEGPPPYHTIVRDNVIRDCGTAVNAIFMMPNHGPASVAPIVGCRFARNRFENSLRKALTLQNMSDVVFRGNVFVGGSSEISTNRCGTVVFK